jgi:hypothetical protein
MVILLACSGEYLMVLDLIVTLPKTIKLIVVFYSLQGPTWSHDRMVDVFTTTSAISP